MMKKRLPNREFRKLVPKLRKKGFYKPKEERKINWHDYNNAQINEAVLIDYTKKIVNSCVQINHKKVGRPLTNPRELAKAILVSELLCLPERQSQGYVQIFSKQLGIRSRLDDRVIGNAYNRLEIMFILKQVFEKTKTCDGILSGDGSGLETTRKQNYESEKKTGEYFTSIVDSREIVQAFEMSKKEKASMKEMIKQVKGKSLRLDAGFVDKELTKKINELGMKPFIFPKKNLNLNGIIAWKTMYLTLFYDTQEWLREYHQRSHCESFHSSFKRRNRPLMKINALSKLNQLTARIIIHNLKKKLYYDKLATG
jgi:transposase